MEEIIIDFSKQTVNAADAPLLEYLVNKAKKDGVQIGVPWSGDVYNYLFENEKANVDLAPVFGFDIFSEEIVL